VQLKNGVGDVLVPAGENFCLVQRPNKDTLIAEFNVKYEALLKKWQQEEEELSNEIQEMLK